MSLMSPMSDLDVPIQPGSREPGVRLFSGRQRRRWSGSCTGSPVDIAGRVNQMPCMTRSPDWLTVPEIADRLGVDPATIRRWIRERRLRAEAILVGSDRLTYRVRVADFEEFWRATVFDTFIDDWER
jgi:excisionase family DNA binding protein